ncbi:hypothetical protein [Pseudoalteromonas xiamenensis]|uniref:Uncharacterized protein n=1 Tax=Pseudoalteromonas xiamenensis TaxID=882626 RepID=A0A975HJR8_9GAMM|nr:hypothetical protein [Pseudoalteromonas xiamenensis]QTH70271.1 hypothetical protein J5O05_09530 [Pseudoalteromonas xiamenensis]WMN58541.1 hypothetical protein NI389_09730 [Pseudoalteromonas xiamenensis]
MTHKLNKSVLAPERELTQPIDDHLLNESDSYRDEVYGLLSPTKEQKRKGEEPKVFVLGYN